MNISITDILNAEALESGINNSPTMEWKGNGFCKARDVREENDYCNNPTKYTFCKTCECQVHTCHKKWELWNMAFGKYCSKHRHLCPEVD